jgi:hypothetical protein
MPDLTGNTALDVAIGLAFTYLLFSLICSAVQEGFAGVLDSRSKKLEKGIRSMLEDDGPGTGGAPVAPAAPAAPPAPAAPAGPAKNLVDELLGHDLIRSAYKASIVSKVPGLKNTRLRKRRGPSYLDSRTFATALLDLFVPATDAADPLTELKDAIQAANIPAGTKSTLVKMAGTLAEDRNHLRGIVEQWYDDTMARVSGWYKRQAQIVLCVLAAAVTIGLNVNTVSITERLIQDKTVRTAVAQQGANFKNPTGDTVKKAAKRADDLGQLGIPFGWDEKANDPAKVEGHFWRTVAGWFVTFVALSLGAPFWFDALSKLARLRNSGVPEAPHETTPRRKDDPPPTETTTTKTVTTAPAPGAPGQTTTTTTKAQGA